MEYESLFFFLPSSGSDFDGDAEPNPRMLSLTDAPTDALSFLAAFIISFIVSVDVWSGTSGWNGSFWDRHSLILRPMFNNASVRWRLGVQSISIPTKSPSLIVEPVGNRSEPEVKIAIGFMNGYATAAASTEPSVFLGNEISKVTMIGDASSTTSEDGAAASFFSSSFAFSSPSFFASLAADSSPPSLVSSVFFSALSSPSAAASTAGTSASVPAPAAAFVV
mmetsp:Transcript_45481/g.110659  ORF Transcript_45481/g.110659 Transcript_45481/m.110659 type:complete len:222 (-) Transcript_45481:440-1105(-)